MEMMDEPAIHAAEAFVSVGYPLDVAALLIVELEGPRSRCDYARRAGRERSRAQLARRTSARRHSERERLAFWAGRKAAFPAVGRISPDYYCMDGTIPRRELPRVLGAIARDVGALSAARRERVSRGRRQPASLDPLRRELPGELDRAEAFGAEILKLCVDIGGVLTGEHGVGIEKRDLMPYVHPDRPGGAAPHQARVRCPGPAQSGQGVSDVAPLRGAGARARARRQVAFPDLPRF